jgi:transcriptional regulator with PAS, ATPase and Fis domain
VAVNCAALAEGVLESELFGHVRGAFTGAIQDRPGHFRAAQGGTLFLDEIGDIAGAVQQRLLRVLQEREVVPLGASRPVPVDVRLVAATHRDLRAAVAEGGFRDDLYFRLDVYRIRLPPLRERRGDIPLLVEHFLATRARDGAAPAVSPLAVRTLLAHHWPGNVRELFSSLESALIRAGGASIQAQHLPESVRRSSAGHGEGERYRASAEDPDERAAIERALREANGVRVRAAEILGMGRTTLWRKMKEYGLEETP